MERKYPKTAIISEKMAICIVGRLPSRANAPTQRPWAACVWNTGGRNQRRGFLAPLGL